MKLQFCEEFSEEQKLDNCQSNGTVTNGSIQLPKKHMERTRVAVTAVAETDGFFAVQIGSIVCRVQGRTSRHMHYTTHDAERARTETSFGIRSIRPNESIAKNDDKTDF
jgi:hypothetical protein